VIATSIFLLGIGLHSSSKNAKTALWHEQPSNVDLTDEKSENQYAMGEYSRKTIMVNPDRVFHSGTLSASADDAVATN
jgi:hypothetical protein